MLAVALAVPLALALAAAGALALRRRRSRGSRELAPMLGPLPAGLKHLGTTVSDLSDVGFHLSARRLALRRKPRLGASLLGLRQS
jgi:hypothetical protein